MEAIRKLQRSRDMIKKIVKQVKELEAPPENYKVNEDSWCVCLDHFKENQHIIELPWNQCHLYHYRWIAEWLSVDPRWPICKTTITPDLIEEKLKGRVNIEDGEDLDEHVNND